MRGPCATALPVLWQLVARAQAHFICQEGDPIMWTAKERDLCCINEQIGCPGDVLPRPDSKGDKPAPTRRAADGEGSAPVMTLPPVTTTPQAAAEEDEPGPEEATPQAAAEEDEPGPEEASEEAASADGAISQREAAQELRQSIQANGKLLAKYRWILDLEKTMDNIKSWKNKTDLKAKFSCDLSTSDSIIEEWGPFKRHFCCRTKGLGCKKNFFAFDCEAGSSDWQNNWPATKMAWCCLHWGVGCRGPDGLPTAPEHTAPEHSDDVGDFVDATTSTAPEHSDDVGDFLDGLGSPDATTSTAPEHSDDVGDFLDGLGSVAGLSSSAAFDCEAGFANWVAGWSESKKLWCCDNENKGCSDSDMITTRRPDKPYNCEDGLRNWEKTWSDAKQGWCCERWERTSVWPAGADEHCCELVGRGCDAAKLPAITADEPGLDCEADVDNWQNAWTVPKKEYCCLRFKEADDWPTDTKYYCCKYDLACPDGEVDAGSRSLPHDCDAGYPDRQTGWSDDKKEWCCANYKRGCPEGLDCSAAPPSEWPQPKKDYCCTTEGLGCDGTPAPSPPASPPTARPVAAKVPSSKAGWMWPWAWPGAARPAPAPPGTSYDCRDSSAFEWSSGKRTWCCQHEQRGCAALAKDADEAVAGDPLLGNGSAGDPYDCGEGYGTSREKWGKNKLEWCCRHRRICPAETATSVDCSSFTIWERTHPNERVDYCCKKEGKGCLPFALTTTAPAVPTREYNCANGAKSWETSWSEEKVHWCCDVEGVCPDGTWYNCDAGFTYEAILHPDAKVKWCCEHEKKGCSLDDLLPPCKVGLANWQNDWTVEKKSSCCTQWGADEEWPTDTRKFCCMYKGIGCPKNSTRAPTTTTTTDPMNCMGGHYSGWSAAKKAYCCVQFKEQGMECPGGWDTAPSPTEETTTTTTTLAPPKETTTTTTTLAPPKDPFDCEAGLDHWQHGWSESKKKWCCDNEGKGCKATTEEPKRSTTPRRSDTTSTAEEVTPESTSTAMMYDCDAGFRNWVAGWSNDKKDYCCKTVNRGCVDGTTPSYEYNCQAGYDNWRLGWSAKKMEWCCKTEGLGCADDDTDATGTTTQQTYDCKDGFDDWRTLWATAKKKYCCDAQGRGCEEGKGEAEKEEDFDCQAGIGMWLTGWSGKKKDFCCKTKGFPCQGADARKSSSTTSWDDDTFTGPPGVPLTSARPGGAGEAQWPGAPSTSGASSSAPSGPAGSSTTSSASSSASSSAPQYSCKAKAPNATGNASESYDCHEGLWDWAKGWTDAKKEWCCTNELLWCPEWASSGTADTSDWSVDQKDYCCRAERVGCTATEAGNATEGMSKFAVRLRRAVEPRASPLGFAAALTAAGTLALGAVAYRRGIRGGTLEGRGSLEIYAPIYARQANDMTAPLN